MDRAIIRNPDLSWTMVEDERRLDLPADITLAELDIQIAAFFTPESGEVSYAG